MLLAYGTNKQSLLYVSFIDFTIQCFISISFGGCAKNGLENSYFRIFLFFYLGNIMEMLERSRTSILH